MKKSEKTELTISKILEAAMNEFGKNGYSGGTINNILTMYQETTLYPIFV